MDEKIRNEEVHFDETVAQTTLESGYVQAEEMLKDQDKMKNLKLYHLQVRN